MSWISASKRKTKYHSRNERSHPKFWGTFWQIFTSKRFAFFFPSILRKVPFCYGSESTPVPTTSATTRSAECHQVFVLGWSLCTSFSSLSISNAWRDTLSSTQCKNSKIKPHFFVVNPSVRFPSWWKLDWLMVKCRLHVSIWGNQCKKKYKFDSMKPDKVGKINFWKMFANVILMNFLLARDLLPWLNLEMKASFKS